MPHVLTYDQVLQSTQAAGLRCAYPNGGAFTLDPVPGKIACWAHADREDMTVRPAMRPRVVAVSRDVLPELVERAWDELFPKAGQLWLTPVHHWAAELQHGDGAWLEPLLADLSIDTQPLRNRTQADALAFDRDEREPLRRILANLLEHLSKSDFGLLLPGERVVGTVHHHGQLWWQCETAEVADRLMEFGDDARSTAGG